MSDIPLTIRTANDGVELVLTDHSVFMKLSDSVLKQAQSEMQQDLKNDEDVQKGGLAARFANFVTNAVDNLLHHVIEYPLEDIKSVTYQDGGLVFTYNKKKMVSFEVVQVDSKPVLKSFAEADARAFVERFAEVKQHAS